MIAVHLWRTVIRSFQIKWMVSPGLASAGTVKVVFAEAGSSTATLPRYVPADTYCHH